MGFRNSALHKDSRLYRGTVASYREETPRSTQKMSREHGTDLESRFPSNPFIAKVPFPIMFSFNKETQTSAPEP